MTRLVKAGGPGRASRARFVVMVGAPGLALATFAVGLRVGAGFRVRAAEVRGAAPGALRGGVAWQVRTAEEEGGVREAVALPVVVRLRAETPGGAEGVWRGRTNDEGVAEAWLPLPGVAPGDAVVLQVEEDGRPGALAKGTVVVPARRGEGDFAATSLSPAAREGAVALSVAFPDGRLSTLGSEPLWVRAVDGRTGAPLGGVALEGEGEQGLVLDGPRATTNADGWGALHARASDHLAGLHVTARAADGRRGTWFGPVPVARGAPFVPLPPRIDGAAPTELVVVARSAARRAYVEVDDGEGRVAAWSLPLELAPDGLARGAFTLPPVGPGLRWITATGDPLGSATLGPTTLTRAFVAVPPGGARADPSEVTARAPVALPLAVLLDGFHEKYRELAAARRRGMALAVGALVVAALAEAILVFDGALRARRHLRRALDEVDPEVSRAAVGAHAPWVTLVVSVLVAILGFLLLAAVTMTRPT